jgi:hypothetical protein
MAGSSFTGPLKNSQHQTGPRASRSRAPMSYGEAGYFVVFDDFVGEDTFIWTTVEDTSAVSGVLADAPNGVFELAGTASDDTGASIQLTNEVFDFSSGNEGWFETRIMLEDADQQDVYVGFTVNFATNPEAVLTAADRIGFQIDDGNASILCKTERSGTETSTDSGVDATDLTTATDPDDSAWIKLGIHIYDTNDSGGGTVEFWINDLKVATHTTNIPDDEYLSVAAFSLNGEAVQNSLHVDYIYAAGTR